MKHLYKLLDGTTVDGSGLSARQRRLIQDVQQRAADGIGYTDLLTAVFHPLSPLWDGKAPREETARGPLLAILPDLCARVAIASAQFENDHVSVSEFSRIRGVSRQAVYDASTRGELDLELVGGIKGVVVNTKSRSWQPSVNRQTAGSLGAIKKNKHLKPRRLEG
jgi:hypothetical protein